MGLNNLLSRETKDTDKSTDNGDSLSFDSSLNEEAGHSAVVQVDKNLKEIGFISATFLCLNRMIGSGVFSLSSTIFLLSGSVGTALFMWVAGSLIAFSGLLVYMEFGSAIPRNGGEKNYLEYVYKSPRFLVTAMYGAYVFFLGWAAGNSVVVGEYLLNAAQKEVTQWNSRAIGIGVITFAFLIDSVSVKAGLWLGNALGVFKVVIILFIVVTGWVALGDGIKTNDFKSPNNFTNAFEGFSPSGYGVVNAIYNVIWSYVGYSNANYALGEAKNPNRVLKIAAPVAFLSLMVLYMLTNIAYFAVIPKEELGSSGRIVAATFFKHAFGNTAERAASVFVALSALGNVLSVIFSQGRIIQQLGREGSLPFSRLWASSKPFNSPFFGLGQHWIVCIVTIVAPPPGDAYNFVLNLISYPLNVVNTFVGIGLLYLNIQAKRGNVSWNPPIRASIPVIIFFSLSSLYLIVAPYIPPDAGQSVYNDLPYWIHCVVTWAVFAIGLVYWVVWARILPYFGNYKIVVKEMLGEDGFWRNKFYNIANDGSNADILEEPQ